MLPPKIVTADSTIYRHFDKGKNGTCENDKMPESAAKTIVFQSSDLPNRRCETARRADLNRWLNSVGADYC